MWIFYIILLIFYIVIYVLRGRKSFGKKTDKLFTILSLTLFSFHIRKQILILTKKSVYEKKYLFGSIFNVFRRRINCGSSTISSQ